MSYEEVWSAYWNLLYSDLVSNEAYPTNRPLLAHYTSLTNLEDILKNDEIWLSNPLFMNDLEEVRFGVVSGLDIIRLNENLRDALKTDARRGAFFSQLDRDFEEYGANHVLDLYVMCFSIHVSSDIDGRLSMWRGYGRQGKGAAIVFDTAALPVPPASAFVLGEVVYATQDERKNLIREKIEKIARFIDQYEIPDKYVRSHAAELFKRLYLFAIFSKHDGFREEQEWRLVYLKDRDEGGSFEKYFGYFNGVDGIQPKLKLPIQKVGQESDRNFKFANIVKSIIIGPTASSPLAKRSIERMLDKIGKAELKQVVSMSGIPFRG